MAGLLRPRDHPARRARHRKAARLSGRGEVARPKSRSAKALAERLTLRDCARILINASPKTREMPLGSHFAFNGDGRPFQSLEPTRSSERFEGIAFSSSGALLAVVTAETNCALLFRRRATGSFEEKPFCRISGPQGGLDYPHDVSFATCGGTELMAVAQRTGAIALYDVFAPSDDPSPAATISGSNANLEFTDGVAFVPPANDWLAACNLQLGTINFYRRIAQSPLRFEQTPAFQLKHAAIHHPDGLAFSPCGNWLAIANHGLQTIAIFRRRGRPDETPASGEALYGPEPSTIISDPSLRYPHSVAFTPKRMYLAVTNAGANYINVYAPRRRDGGMTWSAAPAFQATVGDEETFRDVNSQNRMEGGPKGIAIAPGMLAICIPELGAHIYSFRERLGPRSLALGVLNSARTFLSR